MLPWLLLALAAPDRDDAVRARIAAWRPVAEAVVVDGDDADWGEIYAMRGVGDIAALRIAPTAEALAVVVRLGPEADVLRPLLVSVDTGGDHPIDTILKVHGTTVFVNWHEGRQFQPVPEAVAAQGDRVVELRVPWEALRRQAPAGHDIHLAERGWMRVRVQQGKSDGEPRSAPLALASYRLTDPPPPLDEAPQMPSLPRVDGRPPLAGTWFITQGALNPSGTHATTWAYDVVVRDRSHRARLGKEPEDTLAWGRPVVSPGRGAVQVAVDGFPDKDFDEVSIGPERANRVVVDLDDRTRVRVAHLQEGSVAVQEGQRVQPGQLLGKVGNSGNSSGPHVHVVYTHADGKPAPVRWKDVTAQLNPVADDPWARRPAGGWEPRGGWFFTVDPLPEPEPTLPQPLAIPVGN